MKTALNQLIEKWESERGSYIPNGEIYKEFIKEAKTFLPTESKQIDDFAVAFSEWKDNNCIYYDGWNVKIPLGEKYNDVYTNKELLEIFKKIHFKM